MAEENQNEERENGSCALIHDSRVGCDQRVVIKRQVRQDGEVADLRR